MVITATTTRGIHSLHIWHIEYQQTGAVEELISTVAMAHSNAIISICAVPAGTLRSRGVACAFVTCSKGNGGTSTDDDRGTIRAWTMEGTTVEMQLEHGGFVEELHCQASVSQVMITVNNQGHILLLAAYFGDSIGIERWNWNVLRRSRPGMLVILFFFR